MLGLEQIERIEPGRRHVITLERVKEGLEEKN